MLTQKQDPQPAGQSAPASQPKAILGKKRSRSGASLAPATKGTPPPKSRRGSILKQDSLLVTGTQSNYGKSKDILRITGELDAMNEDEARTMYTECRKFQSQYQLNPYVEMSRSNRSIDLTKKLSKGISNKSLYAFCKRWLNQVKETHGRFVTGQVGYENVPANFHADHEKGAGVCSAQDGSEKQHTAAGGEPGPQLRFECQRECSEER